MGKPNVEPSHHHLLQVVVLPYSLLDLQEELPYCLWLLQDRLYLQLGLPSLLLDPPYCPSLGLPPPFLLCLLLSHPLFL